MMCQRCQKATATVHVDEVETFIAPGHADNEVTEHHLCERCASEAQLPGGAAPQKTVDEIWHILSSAGASGASSTPPARPTLECESCGMTLEELRRKGRLGCEHCYEVFEEHLTSLLERMHGSVEHVGRLPGVDEQELARRKAIEEAQAELSEAIAAEQFERAAELRDQLQSLDPPAELA